MAIFLFLILFTATATTQSEYAFAAVPTHVKCPSPSWRTIVPNHIFFSFYKKELNLGAHLPRNLVLLDTDHTKNGAAFCLTKQTYTAFKALNAALEKETNSSLLISSAWRSFATQKYFATTRGEFAAIPGRSEHQLGTTIDIVMKGALPETLFVDSVAYEWMTRRAHEYGFVQSFTARDVLMTGIPEEPWHWRYVGKTIATAVYNTQKNINEFLQDRKDAQVRTKR